MTIASEVNRSGPYACNGATTHFPYGFRIYDTTHIRVILTDPLGTETTLSLGTDYMVWGVGQSGGGAVDTIVAYAAGYRVTLILNVPFTQNIDLENQGAYFAETIERAIDQQTQMSLQLKEQVARAVVLPVTSSVSVDTLTSAVLSLSDIQPQMQALAPIAQDIKTVAGISGAVVAAEGNANTATAAAGVATGKAAEAAASAEAAKTWNPTSYSTTAQITTMLGGYVPTGRRLKVGAGLSLDGIAGSDAEPAEGDLSKDRFIGLTFATQNEAAGGTITGKPIDPAGLAVALATLGRIGTIKGVVEISVSGNYIPSAGTKSGMAIKRGGGGGGGGTNGTNGATGGGEGGLALSIFALDDTTTYPVIIGAGGSGGVPGGGGYDGGNTSIVVAGVTYYASGGNGGPDAVGSSAGGGSPSATSPIGMVGNASSGTYGGNSLWRQSGNLYGRGGAGKSAGSKGSGSNGETGHMTIVEFGK